MYVFALWSQVDFARYGRTTAVSALQESQVEQATKTQLGMAGEAR